MLTIVIPMITIARDSQYPMFEALILLLNVPLNRSAIPISPNGMTSKLYEAVDQCMGSQGGSGGRFACITSPRNTLMKKKMKDMCIRNRYEIISRCFLNHLLQRC
jgi:hypothetical protein